MNTDTQPTWIAFAGTKRIAFGRPRDVARTVKSFIDSERQDSILIFDAVTSHPVELDFRGSMSAVLDRLLAIAPPEEGQAPYPPLNVRRSAGRPKLGVTAREVTLLPRHWDWLASQPSGASVALRKLVEHAMRANKEDDRVRQAREAAYRFMHAMAGNEPGFEEATRALFAGDYDRLSQTVASWSTDVREHAIDLAKASVVGKQELEHAP